MRFQCFGNEFRNGAMLLVGGVGLRRALLGRLNPSQGATVPLHRKEQALKSTTAGALPAVQSPIGDKSPKFL